MINIIIVLDDLDASIGTNSTLSHKYFKQNVKLNTCKVVLLNEELSTSEEVEKAIGSFNGEPFILVAFSHGSEDCLLSSVSAAGYLHVGNSYFFGSSLVYTNCCYSGKKLKESLINSGCFGYVGYTDEVRLPHNEDDEILFIECEVSGLIHFLNSGDSLSDSMSIMENKYLNQYKAFTDQNMYVAAALLLHNLNCLTYYDKGALTFKEFVV